MKKFGQSIEFKRQLVLETAYSSKVLSKNCKVDVQIWIDDDCKEETARGIEYCDIESCYTDTYDVRHCGCWFERGRLTDYDRVFEMNMDEITTLRKNGFVVPREFEPERR